MQKKGASKLKAIYCINLEASTVRHSRMTTLFSNLKLDVPIYHFSALKGSSISNMNVDIASGHKGCLLSHMNLWHHIAQLKNDDFYLIMEDDLELSAEVDAGNFKDDFNQLLDHIPNRIKMVHLSRDISKMFVKNKWISKFEPRYQVLHTMKGLQLKSCLPFNPWSTEAGAILMKPIMARKLFKFAKFSLQNDRLLPFNNNIDMIISRYPVTHLSGAMIKIFQQNIGVSDLQRINKQDQNEHQIPYNEEIFQLADKRLKIWNLA
jgi:GR25 family glycosyltransferase involved in LPS biosynthesis